MSTRCAGQVRVGGLVVVVIPWLLLAPARGETTGYCSHEYWTPEDGQLPGGQIGLYYDQFYEYDCSDSGVDWSVQSGMLPPGLSLVEDPCCGGIYYNLRGVPVAAGTFSYSLLASAWWGGSHVFNNSIKILNPPGCGTIQVQPASLPGGTVGAPYTQQVVATGGTAPYSFAVTWGSLPPGLALAQATGIVSGTPTYVGSYAFWITATDASGCTGSAAYAIAIGATCSLSIGPPWLPPGRLGVSYSATLSGAGGVPPYSFDFAGGSLPGGLWLYPSGLLSGTPWNHGRFTFDVRMTDAVGCETTHPFVLEVMCGRGISPPTLPGGTAGLAYQVHLQGMGGSGPDTFSLNGGALPPGLALSPAGVIAGTGTKHGLFSFVVRMTDAAGCIDDFAFTLSMRGYVDFLAGMGRAQPNPNAVKAVTPSGVVFTTLLAYSTGSYGVAVTGGDLDGNQRGDIVTGPGPGPVHGPHVRGFRALGSPITTVSFYAYGTLRYGVNVQGADLERDGNDEILTGPGGGPMFGPHVRGWNVDGGPAQAIPNLSFFTAAGVTHGTAVGAADADGCSYPEILTAPGPSASLPADVRGWYYRGGPVTAAPRLSFTAFASSGHGARVRGGDVDGDFFDEIVCSHGPGPTLTSRARGFNFDDRTVTSLQGFDVVPFPTLHGATVASGDVTRDGADDLVAGAGPDPSAPARVRLYRYDGVSLNQEPIFLLLFHGASYGVEVAWGHLDVR